MASALLLLEVMFVVYKRQLSATVSLSTLVGLVIFIEVIVQPLVIGKTQKQLCLTWGALLAMLVAFLLRNAETDKAWGRPLCLFSTWFQPHALWHMLSALAMAMKTCWWPRRGP